MAANVRMYLNDRIQKILGDLPQHLHASKGYTVAKLYYKVKEYDMAIGFLQLYFHEKEDAMAHELMANCYRRRKTANFPKALEHFQRSIEMDCQQSMVTSTANYGLDLATVAKRKHLMKLKEKVNELEQLQALETKGIKALSKDLRSLRNQFRNSEFKTESKPLAFDHQSDLQALNSLDAMEMEQGPAKSLEVAAVPQDTFSVDTQSSTGQEGEEIKFCHLAALFRNVDQESIDLSLGFIKILRNSTTGVSRVFMRCAETDQLFANHQIMADMTLFQDEQDEEKKSLSWMAYHVVDGLPTMAQFRVRLVDPAKAETFRLAFARANEEAKEQEASDSLTFWAALVSRKGLGSLRAKDGAKAEQEQRPTPVSQTETKVAKEQMEQASGLQR
ncbi:E3 SUMO-protein ligase RanBP2-like [Drosophila kikkawai]|uniref:E3 SUMO-protein ligase RanBP2-like n=1 Tax=Drosophila kikkawai TaxID=30033 RepID=A0A6P4JKM9_DROKI|nr:E3 SUMO-protein ligase RanBP2-like [Drosophila kikkawai]